MTRTRRQDHIRAGELATRLRNVPGPPIEWSDGNKLRYLVMAKFLTYLNDGTCEDMHRDGTAWDILRIADRLDHLDEVERGPMPSFDLETGDTQ